MAFSGSSKREDVSARLRAQNMKNAKEQTKQLEVESRKMEERLQELKIVMGKEKEQREKQGGGYWRAGQKGSLGTYGSDVLAKPARPAKEKGGQRTRKIKILREEQIAPAPRSRAPGTMSYLASKGASHQRETKIKGPKCGQCEEKAAQVSCLECGEDYCAACFAAFHLKGALKKHRSIPIGSNGARTPRGMPLPSRSNLENQPPGEGSTGDRRTKQSSGTSNGSIPDTDNPMKVTLTEIDFRMTNEDLAKDFPPSNSSRKAPEGPSLLDGTYSETEAAMSFQQALKAWRNGDSSETNQTARTVSPVLTPRVNVESGTSTVSAAQKPVEITFKTSSLSYAEKLLLKKHRRTELGPLTDGSVSSRSEGGLSTYRVEASRYEGSGREPSHLSDSDRVDFQSLYQTMTSARGSSEPSRCESRVSIIELTDVPPQDLEQSSHYRVTDIEEERVLLTEVSTRIAEADCTVPVKKRAFENPRSARRRLTNSGRNSQNASLRGSTADAGQSESGTARGTSVAKQRSSGGGSSTTGRNSANAHKKSSNDSKLTDHQKEQVKYPPETNDLKNQKVKVAKSQPKATPRSKSRSQSRAGGTQSRAKSRAESRLELFGEGTLTKKPSAALHDIARMTPDLAGATSVYTQGLGEFFTVGVQPSEEFQERTLTPTTSRKAHKDGRWKISNKCYQMAPRSWHPDQSLGDTVPDSDAMQHLEDVGMKHYRDFEGTPAPEEESGRKSQVLSWSLSEGQTLREMTRLSEAAAAAAGAPASQTSRPTSASLDPDNTRPVSSRSQRAESRSGRESQMIVMDGEDLSIFDSRGWEDDRQADDEEALDQLEYELASQTGRLTEDGKVSRLSCLSPDLNPEEEELGVISDDGRGTGLSTPDRGFDIHNNLNEEDLMDDFEEMEARFQEEEVKALH